MQLQQKTIYLVTLISLSFTACKNTHKIIAIDPRFAQHISGYTSGMLSSKNKIRIELATPIVAQANGLPDSNLLEHAFSFSPNIKGHSIWINDRSIEFIPEEKLEAATFYNATFKLSQFKKVEDDLKKFQLLRYPIINPNITQKLQTKR
jgi:alpha-2-macroglobulin